MDGAQPLAAWVGRTQTLGDRISPVQVRQMAATLDDAARLADPALGPLPACWHWLYFNPLEVQSRLGPDGHPERGDFLPPVPQPRRMWAGSRLNWTRHFEVGSEVRKTSEIVSVEHKKGRTGEMVLVTVRHRYDDARGPILSEDHDIVYRDAPSADELAALAQLAEQVRAGTHAFEREGSQVRRIEPDAVLLYRYSAATFNGHRIHYDADYARSVEGYPGLVVHGPLIATLMLAHAHESLGGGRDIAAFEFRAMRPTFDIAAFHLHAAPGDSPDVLQAWSTDNLGRVGVQGRITLS